MTMLALMTLCSHLWSNYSKATISKYTVCYILKLKTRDSASHFLFANRMSTFVEDAGIAPTAGVFGRISDFDNVYVRTHVWFIHSIVYRTWSLVRQGIALASDVLKL